MVTSASRIFVPCTRRCFRVEPCPPERLIMATFPSWFLGDGQAVDTACGLVAEHVGGGDGGDGRADEL
ncbi:hypothetical protein GCM10028820_00840 [Tessaracoccus terricola]